MSGWEGLNRRKFPRVSYPCLVVVNHREEKEEIILTHTENISIGGICVTLKRNIRTFSYAHLEIDLMDLQDHVRCKGKVVWNVQRKGSTKTKPLFYDIGIEFEDIADKDRQRLQKIVDHLAKFESETKSSSV